MEVSNRIVSAPYFYSFVSPQNLIPFNSSHNDKVTGCGLTLKAFVKRKNLLKGKEKERSKEKAVRFTDLLEYLYDSIPIMLGVSVKISHSGN